MRLFTAISLPPPLRRQLAQLAQKIRHARPLPSHQLHLTLVFLGEVNPRDLEPIELALAEIEVPLLELQTTAIGSSGSRVIWIGVQPSGELLALQREIRRQLRGIDGLSFGKRRYSPHVTLARYRGQPPDLGDLVAQHQRCSYRWSVDRFGLYSSQLHPEGAVHRLESEFVRPPPLRPSRPPHGN